MLLRGEFQASKRMLFPSRFLDACADEPQFRVTPRLANLIRPSTTQANSLFPSVSFPSYYAFSMADRAGRFGSVSGRLRLVTFI